MNVNTPKAVPRGITAQSIPATTRENILARRLRIAQPERRFKILVLGNNVEARPGVSLDRFAEVIGQRHVQRVASGNPDLDGPDLVGNPMHLQ